MQHLNWGHIQLALLALAVAGLQVWWISNDFWTRDQARPMSEGAFPKALEPIWAKGQGTP
jgi:hypothetical protein